MSFPIAHTVEQATSMFDQTQCVQLVQGLPIPALTQALEQIRQLYEFIGNLPIEHQPYGYQSHDSIEPETLDPAIFGQTGTSIIDFVDAVVKSNVPGQVMRRVLGSDIESLRTAVRIRRHDGAISRTSFVPWHQDIAFLGIDEPWITCWIPLTPCGADNPALDFIPKITSVGFAASLEGDGGGYGMGGILNNDLEGHFGPDAIWTPEFTPGDCMMFSSFCVHRTSLRSRETSERLSMEIRFHRKPQ